MKTRSKTRQCHTNTTASPLTITVDGKPIKAFQGETIASALMRNGHFVSRTIDGKPLGVYCNIGVCHSCVMTVNGQLGVRICQTPVSDGCRIDSQHFQKGSADD